jgi:preprotein translocase subunit SecY
LLTGTHHVARWVAGDPGDAAFPAIVVAYAVVSVVLLASAFLVFEAVRNVPVREPGSKGRDVKERIVPLHLLGGGVIVPMVLANFAISFIPTMVMEMVLRLSDQKALTYWSGLSPLPLVVIAYHLMLFTVIVLACLATTALQVNPGGRPGATCARSVAGSPSWVAYGWPVRDWRRDLHRRHPATPQAKSRGWALRLSQAARK